MAENDPLQLPDENTPETVVIVEETPVIVEEAPVIIEEVPLYIPPDRPRKVYAGMWGPFEIASVAIAFMTMLASVLLFFFFVVPSNLELSRNKSEADRLDVELMSAQTKYGEITDTETQVARLVQSVDDFETQHLSMQTNGQAALYQRLNGLIRAYGLENTTGPDYAPLETADLTTGAQTDEDKGRTKYRSLYPGVYVTTTLEGSYQNLRRFIREIETSREFLVVSAIELAPSDTETKDAETPPARANVNPAGVNPAMKGFVQPPPQFSQPQQSRPPQSKGKTQGETVALSIEMAAYFRRPGFVPMSTKLGITIE